MLAAACAGATVPGSTPAAPVPGGTGPVAAPGAIERAVLAELNAVRTDPAAYATKLQMLLLPHFDGKVLRRPGRTAIRTHEGAAAVREAVTALRAIPPGPAVRLSPAMSNGARDHVEDQGPRGAFGHTGSDGSTFAVRVNRYGRWTGRINESLSYGPASGSDVVQSLIVDDGVRDRGHRRNLLDPEVRVAGLACGPHATYRIMCVIDLAGGFQSR